MSKYTSSSVIGNMAWRFFERCGAQGVSLVVSIILARLLSPTDYGTIALVTVFTTVLQVFVDSGFGSALIQKKDADDLDFSTVFYFNMTVCLILYLGMFLAAPFIASFYENAALTQIIRVISLTLVISGIKNIQQAYVSRKLIFKKFFFATLGGTIGAAVVGIVMAYKGCGVWALVAQQLFNATVDTIILWVTVKWRPKLMFSWQRLKDLFLYGWKLLASALLNTIYQKIRQMLIGKLYSPASLAFYNKGDMFPNTIVANINTSIDSVLFPAMSKEQDNSERIKSMTRRAIKLSSYIMWPIMFGLAVTATPLVRLLLTEKWLPCVLFLRIFCFVYGFQPMQTANLNAIKAMGRSDIFLKLEIAKKIIGLTAMFATVFISVEAMAYSYFVTTVLSVLINAYPNRKLLNYSYRDQFGDILPPILLSSVMSAICFAISFVGLNDLAIIAIQVPVGIVVYAGLSKAFQIDSFIYLLNMIKTWKKNRIEA